MSMRRRGLAVAALFAPDLFFQHVPVLLHQLIPLLVEDVLDLLIEDLRLSIP